MKKVGSVLLVFVASVFCLGINGQGVIAAKPLHTAYERAIQPQKVSFCDGRPGDNQSYCWRNCTSFVAYQLAAVGVAPSYYQYLGHAKSWAANAVKRKVQTGTVPRVGAVAYWEHGGKGFGHVAWVEAINADGSVRVSSYNGFTESYYAQDFVRPEGYIYFSNVQTPPKQPSLERLLGAAKSKGNRLHAGQLLKAGQYLAPTNKRHGLILQTDGNLVLYNKQARAVWYSGTAGSGADSLALQPDGNLVIFRGRTPLWSTGTVTGRATLVVQNDGNLVLYRANGRAVWQSGTVTLL
jgi:surface antigen